MSAIQELAAVEATTPARTDGADPTVTTGSLPAITGPIETIVEPRISNRLARTIMVATAAIVACGVAAAFSVLTGGGSARLQPSTPTVGPTKITGPAVVRPDLLNDQLAGGLLTVGRVAGGTASGGPTVSPSRSVGSLQPQDEARAAVLIDPAGAGANAVGASPAAEQVRELVRGFYEATEASPDQAFQMLGPEMRGDGQESFVKCWNDVIVEVPQVEGGEGGVVRAVVVIAWPDATVLRTEQLLVVSDGPEPKIVRAELLSAHRG